MHRTTTRTTTDEYESWEFLDDLSEIPEDEVTEDQVELGERVWAAEQVITDRVEGLDELRCEAECGWNIRFFNTRRGGVSA